MYKQDIRNLGSALLALGYYSIIGGALCVTIKITCTGLEMSGLVKPTTDDLVAK